jgi:ribosomal protein S18 acetylase RimI-like enzyme
VTLPGVSVRPIELADIGSLADCVAAVIAERAYLAFTVPFALEETARFVAGNIRLGNPQFVAAERGRIVGWCDVVRSILPVHLHSGVLGMGVLAAYRAHGLGRKLIGATIGAARVAGFERIDLVVYGRNTRAASLYRKAGFREIGRRIRGKKLDGDYDDELLMELVFDEVTT